MKFVVDTNIVFSGLLNPNGKIGDILLNSNQIEFFAPNFILEELENHKEKILKIAKLSESEIKYLKRMIFKKVDLIDLNNIKEVTFLDAYNLTKDIDEFDIPFVALALELDAPLWTGDKKLRSGLSKKGIDWILSTNEILEIREEL